MADEMRDEVEVFTIVRRFTGGYAVYGPYDFETAQAKRVGLHGAHVVKMTVGQHRG